MTRENSTARYAYIDFLRVFSILLVILLHCIGGYWFDPNHIDRPLWKITAYANELCRVGVPLFFMMSGFLLLNRNIEKVGTFYKRRFLKIAGPFLLYDIFYYLALPMSAEPRSFFGWLKELLNSGSAYHLWFIYSILLLYLFVPFIRKIIENAKSGELFLFFILCIFQSTIKPLFNTILAGKAYLYLSDDGFVGYLGYMILGYILGKSVVSGKLRGALYAAGILSFIVCPLFVMQNLRDGKAVWLNGGYTVNHYLEAAALFCLCKNRISRSNSLLSRLSGLSMDTYFIHVFVLETVKKFGGGGVHSFGADGLALPYNGHGRFSLGADQNDGGMCREKTGGVSSRNKNINFFRGFLNREERIRTFRMYAPRCL